MLTVGAVMAVIMAVSAGPASADDWDHGWNSWDHHGCWKWSWVFEEWKWDCDHEFWWERERVHDLNWWDHNRDRNWWDHNRDRNRHKNDGRRWHWRD